MALLWTDGFDYLGTIAQLDSIYSRPVPAGVTLTTSGGRNGRGAIQVSCSSNSRLLRNLGSDYTTLVIGAAFKDNGTAAEFPVFQTQTSGGSNIFTLTRSSGGVLVARRGAGNGSTVATGTNQVGVNQYGYIECKIVVATATGSVITHINGAVDINAAGLNTQGAAGGIRNAGFGAINVSGQVATFDDFYIDDSTFRGDMTVEYWPVNVDLATMDWTPSATGAVEAVLDETTANSDTDYATATGDGARSEFGTQNPGYGGSVTIHSVQTVAVARQESAGSHGLIVGIGVNGTWDNSTKRSLTTSYGVALGTLRTTNPDTSSAWLPAEIDDVDAAIEYDAT